MSMEILDKDVVLNQVINDTQNLGDIGSTNEVNANNSQSESNAKFYL